ncbi:HAD hydrolase-like protein [Polycladidibacter hongkongensis]|uniref:HAD hydrolase-like protein n=1 Tax=Polycladidibacter hongkongensis TaxID=1647556 RepID=UPI0008294EFF|nr:HAD hydrolase-like protein [Pseudovibrio hongkongensis]
MDAVLFDLDGTLTNPYIGITSGFQHALAKMGRDVPERDVLKIYIGPPIEQGIASALGSDDPAEIEAAVKQYRSYYDAQGLFENHIYDGIVEVLAALTDMGVPLFVATSKIEGAARRIVTHFGLEPYFKEIYGSFAGGARADKGELIKALLEAEGLASDRVVMIGDRKYDLIGARKNKVTSIGVLWGFGTQDELEQEEPAHLAANPAELLPVLRQFAADAR